MARIAGLAAVVALVAGLSVTGYAAEGEVPTQGEFALSLVEDVGGQTMMSVDLPPQLAAIRLLSDLGVMPEGGWDPDAPLTREVLLSILDVEEDEDLSLTELMDKVSIARGGTEIQMIKR